MTDATALLQVNDASPPAHNHASADGDGRAGESAPLFSALIDRWGDEIYRFSWHLTGNPNDADDLYQETLLKAFRAYRKLPADANHRAWLYRIASNTFISDRRKHGRDNPMSEAMEQTLQAPGLDQARSLDARDLLREVEAFVAGLPPKQRVALVLRKYHGHDYAHIALTLKCSEVAARANVHEALRKVRAQFAHRMEV
jgi:RNA polymerase sigma-70 factor (ECF subfamily)